MVFLDWSWELWVCSWSMRECEYCWKASLGVCLARESINCFTEVSNLMVVALEGLERKGERKSSRLGLRRFKPITYPNRSLFNPYIERLNQVRKRYIERLVL